MYNTQSNNSKGGYEQFSPLAMASEFLCSCWMLLIFLILLLGSCKSTSHWYPVEQQASQTSPSITGHTDGKIYITAVNEDGTINIAESTRPEVWSSWAPIRSPEPAVFEVTTAPVLLSFNNNLHVYVRGADNNLYHTSKQGNSSNWSSWTAIVSDGSVRGRISVTITQNSANSTGEETHIVYPTDNDVRYIRLTDLIDSASQVWEGAIEGVIAGNKTNEVMVAVRFSERMVFEYSKQTTNWAFEPLNSMSLEIHEISNLVLFDKSYNIVFAEQQLQDDVSFNYDYLLRHSWIATASGSINTRTISTYPPDGSNHPLPSLLLYRNKLLTAWRNPNGKLYAARWDNADPMKPWIKEGAFGSGTSRLRPALTAFNHRPFLNSVAYGESNYGNDAYAAIMGAKKNGQIEFIIMSRELMRNEVDREFTIYNSQSDNLNPVCRKPSDQMGPVQVTSLKNENRPMFTEIGFNLWVFPDWLIRNFYSDYTEFFCSSEAPENSWDDSSTPCFRDRLPVYIKKSGGIFNCAGAWVNQNNDYIRIYEELGHYMAPALGFGNNLTPTQETANRIGIPLAKLEEGYDLYAESEPCEDLSNRCTGFTGYSGNYDRSGREHSFMYTIYYYVDRGDEIRQFIQEDIADGNDLLQRKYNWVKENIFRGLEFRNSVEPF